MNDEKEKGSECYNFSGFRDLFKKYKPIATKKQYDRSKSFHIQSQKNKRTSKPFDHDHEPQDHNVIIKVEHDKEQEFAENHHMKRVQTMVRNGNGMEFELHRSNNDNSNNNNNNKHGDSNNKHKDYQLTNCLLRSIILLINSSKKVNNNNHNNNKSVRVSNSELPKHGGSIAKTTFRTTDIDADVSSDSETSTSINKSIYEDSLIAPESCSHSNMNRTCSSKRTSRLAGFEEIGNNGSFIHRNKSINRSKSGPIIFSSSSGMLKPPAIEHKLECTLEDLCYGCVKHIKVSRDVITCTGQRIQQEEMLTVNVKPGWIAGTKVTFQGSMSDESLLAEYPTYPSDVVFTITEKHHPMLLRIEDDLEVEVKISLADALTGCTLTIPLLGDEKMSMEIEEIVYPGFGITLVGQGMPSQNNPQLRGDFNIKFLVDFPMDLTDQQRSQLFKILSA